MRRAVARARRFGLSPAAIHDSLAAGKQGMTVKHRIAIALTAAVLLSACVPARVAGPAGPSAPPPPTYSMLGLESVMGQGARALVSLFGDPDLDIREGGARKLQFLGPACVLDAYLYAPRGGGDPVVTHIDARLPDGRDMDRSSCVAALSRRREAR